MAVAQSCIINPEMWNDISYWAQEGDTIWASVQCSEPATWPQPPIGTCLLSSQNIKIIPSSDNVKINGASSSNGKIIGCLSSQIDPNSTPMYFLWVWQIYLLSESWQLLSSKLIMHQSISISNLFILVVYCILIEYLLRNYASICLCYFSVTGMNTKLVLINQILHCYFDINFHAIHVTF